MDLVRFHSDPEKYMDDNLSDEDLEEKKQSITKGLEQLRKE